MRNMNAIRKTFGPNIIDFMRNNMLSVVLANDHI